LHFQNVAGTKFIHDALNATAQALEIAKIALQRRRAAGRTQRGNQMSAR
jgi:hypothetical protein